VTGGRQLVPARLRPCDQYRCDRYDSGPVLAVDYAMQMGYDQPASLAHYLDRAGEDGGLSSLS
jgi:hypothetical protein